MKPESGNLRKVELQEKILYLLGTAHVSKSSVKEVEQHLRSHHYDAIAVELCPTRHQAIQNPDSLAKMDLFQILKEKKSFMVIANLTLSAYQQRIANEIGVEPGAEMKAAVNIGRELKLPVLLIDREIGITLKRVYATIPWWQRIGLMAGLVSSVLVHEEVSEEEIENLKDSDILESALYQFAEKNEGLFKTLIQERDEYMALRLASELHNNVYRNILVVIGAGHLPGISQHLSDQVPQQEQIGQRLAQLSSIKAASSWLKLIPWLIVLIVLAGFFIGFSRSPNLGWSMVSEWVAINGGLSALGAALAAAHPVTVITAFLAAPLTSLNPMIGAGFVTAAMEIFLRKPQVADFSNLRKDTAYLQGWWRNRVARTLLIFLFSTLGSAAGTYIAGFRIFEKLTTG